MAWNVTDFTESPFNDQVMDTLTEEEILWAKGELERYIAEYVKTDIFQVCDSFYLGSTFTKEHWKNGKAMNPATAEMVINYVPVEEPEVEHPIVIPDEETPEEEPTEELKQEEEGAE